MVNSKNRLLIITASVLLIMTIGINIAHFFVNRDISRGIPLENLTIIPAIEQTESLQHPKFYVEEFVPYIPKGENIASQGIAKSTPFIGVYNALKVTDGKTGGVSYWEGAVDTYPNELSVNFDESRKIHALRILLNPDRIWGAREQTFSVEYIDPAGSRKELIKSGVYGFDPLKGNQVVLEFDPVELNSVILIFTDNTGATGGQVAELEIYSAE